MAQLQRLSGIGAEVVEQTWREVVPSAQLQKLDAARSEFDWASSAVSGMTVVAYDLDASARSAAHPDDQLMACRMVTTEGGAWDDDGPLDGRYPWVAAGRPVYARWEGRARVHALVFDLDLVARTAREITGNDRLTLDLWEVRPRSTAGARQWNRTYRYLAESLLGEDAEVGTLAEAELRRHAVHATLSAFSSAFVESAERTGQTRAAPASVRRALAYIEGHAHQPITIDDVARAARMSTRGLQYAFRRSLDTTPTDWIRRTRLSAAHRDLIAPDGGSIAEIARRWGFEHPSRFAAHYRALYGVNPSHTLRSHR